jgi:hypothetical protein
MVARLTQRESDAFIGFLNAMGAGSGAAAAKCVLRFSEVQTCKGKAADDFTEQARGGGRGGVRGLGMRSARAGGWGEEGGGGS